MSIDNTSFVRWQGRSIKELGKAINLLLGLCLATIGFVISKLLDNNFKFKSSSVKITLIIGTSVILVSAVLLLILIFNRLSAFRDTAQIARKREEKDTANIADLRQEVTRKDRWTWLLFKLSIVSFILGELFIVIGFIIEVSNR